MNNAPQLCPNCNSDDIRFREKRGDWFCDACDHRWYVEGSAGEPSPTEEYQPKIFLSYGRGDDEPFVRRLYESLTAEGIDVWWDRVDMPSRQLTFHQEIQDAIVARNRLLLVVGPHAVASDYVRQEWTFALEADKVVNPVLRLDNDTDYRIIPDELKLLHCEDFRRDDEYDEHLSKLIKQLRQSPPPLGKLISVPNLPAHFLAREDRLKTLREALRSDLDGPVTITGAVARVGLHGMGGIGKSVLAMALAHDRLVRQAFPDGILWISIGIEPDIAQLQRAAHRELGGKGEFQSAIEGKDKLSEILANKSVLLVLDDVWKRSDADAFDVLGPRCRALITTRDAGLLTSLGGTHHVVELFSDDEALRLLAMCVNSTMENLPFEAVEIIAECGRLPLAVALCGGMLQSGTPWSDVLTAIREHELQYIGDEHSASSQHRSLWRAIEVSVQALQPDARQRLAELSVFPTDEPVPSTAIATLWQHTGDLSQRDTRHLLVQLKQRSLIQITRNVNDPLGNVSLHDLIHHFAMRFAEHFYPTADALRYQVIDAYRAKCPHGWANGPNDGYFFQHLCRNLIAVENWDELVAVLTDLQFVQAKCMAGYTFDLVQDYSLTLDALPEMQSEREPERQRQERLRQFAADLIAYANNEGDGLALPVPPDSRIAQERVVKTEAAPSEGDDIGLQSLNAGKNGSSKKPASSFDSSPDPPRDSCLRSFAKFVSSHSHMMNSLPAETIATARNHASFGTVVDQAERLLAEQPRAWLRRDARPSITSKTPLCESKIEAKPTGRIAVSVDDRIIAAACDDKVVRVWDARSGDCLRQFTGAKKHLLAVALSADGRLVAACGWDETVRVWNIEADQCVAIYEVNGGRSKDVAMTSNGDLVVSASNNGRLQIWSTRSQTVINEIETDISLERIAITPDASVIVGCFSANLYVWKWDAEHKRYSTRERSAGEYGMVQGLAIAIDGDTVAFSISNKLYIWRIAEDSLVGPLMSGRRATHICDISSVDIASDSRTLIAAFHEGDCEVWDLCSQTLIKSFSAHAEYISSINLGADGCSAVSASSDGTIGIWNLRGNEIRAEETKHHGEILNLILTPDQKLAVSVGWDSVLRVWDRESGECVWSHEHHASCIDSVAITPDGKKVISGGRDCDIYCVDLFSEGAFQMPLMGHSGYIKSLAVASHSNTFVSGSSDKTLRVWDLHSGRCLQTLAGHTGAVSDVALTADGRFAVSSSWDQTLRIWDLNNGEGAPPLEGHSEQVDKVFLTPDDKHFVSASYDETIGIWTMERHELLYSIAGYQGFKGAVALSDDGRKVIFSAGDDSIHVTSIESGECVNKLDGHSEAVVALAVIPGSSLIVSGSLDKTVRVWGISKSSHKLVAVYQLGVVPMKIACSTDNRLVVGDTSGELHFLTLIKQQGLPSILA